MFKKILTIVTLILIVVVVWSAREDIIEAINYLTNTNIFFVIMLIPEQLFMYYCAGQMFFSYMAAKANAEQKQKQKADKTEVRQDTLSEISELRQEVEKVDNDVEEPIIAPNKVSSWLLARISFELNFVNHAIPSGGVAGLGYITWRLKAFGSSVGQTSFMYALRYVITILSNQFQTIVAIIIMLIMGGISHEAYWVVGLTCLICVGVIAAIAAVIVVASSKKRINWFAKVGAKFVNSFVKTVTFGRKKEVVKRSVDRKSVV